MKINAAEKVIEFLMNLGLVPMLVGATGIGKTTMIKNIGKRTGRKVTILTLSQMEPGDLLGLPMKEGNKTVYAQPDWFPEDGNTILFLDELNRAHNSVRAAVMQLLIDKKLHNHVLPQGTWLVAAMNPETDDYIVNPVIDKAEIARFIWLPITNNPEDWYEYAVKGANDIDLCLTMRDIMLENVAIMAGSETPIIPEIVPTFRGMDMLRLVINNIPDSLEMYLPEIATGIIGKYGPVVVKTYQQRLQNELNYKDLLEGNVEKVKAASSQSRIRAIDGLVSYMMNKFENGKLHIPVRELENAVECLKQCRKEELGPVFRTVKVEHQEVFAAWKAASPKCREFLVSFVLDTLNNASIDQIQN
ncbi:MAG TPA: MoxR family ATPase [Fervidobacterium nodosum]|nr:MoxR family ATPase [Fervidobacterium nodosum]